MKCPELEILEDYAAGELSPERRLEVEAHLEGCASCRRALLREQHLDDLLRHQERLKAPVGFRERVIAALGRQTTAGSYPDWLWALGLGLVVAVVGFLVGQIGRDLFTAVIGQLTGFSLRPELNEGAEVLKTLPGADWLSQLSTANSVLIMNLAVAGIILCWGLWQVVKALRR